MMSSNWQAATTEPISEMLCYYTNSTSKMQLIRVTKSQNLDLEKIVFPQQRLLFEAIPEGQLEIYSDRAGKQSLVEVISCQSLQVNQVQHKPTVVETLPLYREKSA
ncbi:MAG: DUF1830 domain-containing protein [Xenococcaceae cyanobacterium MO_207.B15]|nr:DUF1830 domain-containing protein [Xenococcaceae cyanobacterium MO_207.B15]